MKVLLISSNTASSPYPVYPLGMGAIAAALRSAGHETVMFDWLAQGPKEGREEGTKGQIRTATVMDRPKGKGADGQIRTATVRERARGRGTKGRRDGAESLAGAWGSDQCAEPRGLKPAAREGAERMEAWREALRHHKPGLVGVSIRNLDNVNLLNEKRYTAVVAALVQAVHEELDVPVVLGGSGYSLLPEIVLREAGADYGIVGEGEQLIVELVDSIAQGRKGRRDGRTDGRRDDGTILRNAVQLDGSTLGGAYYDADILGHYLRAGSIAPIQTKRGCNLRCAYCSYPALEGRALRTRPPQDVVDDIEKLQSEHNTSYVFFTDSVFNDDQGAYLEVLREIKRRRVSVQWSAFLKPTGITEETAALMKETGLAAAELGSDAATDTTLRGLRKPFRWRDVVSANDVLRKQGTAVAHYFIFGGPGETPDTVREGIDNIRDLRCTAAFVFMGIRILPHTELHRIALREELIAPDCDLLEPVYYLSPAIERAWVEETLKQGFDNLGHVVFPPDALDDKLQLLHKLGYAGSLWELLGGYPQKTPAV